MALVGIGILGAGLAAAAKNGAEFDFARDTFTFANETIFDYRAGVAYERPASSGRHRQMRYTSHCFVMCRAVVQFKKFARFDPRLPPVDDAELARSVHLICGQHRWESSWPADRRIAILGYEDLRELSEKRARVMQENIGLGWPTYFRPGNWRMVMLHSHGYQAIEQAEMEDALHRGEFFVAYLTTFPSLSINHAVLVYSHRSPVRKEEIVRYLGLRSEPSGEAAQAGVFGNQTRIFLRERLGFVGGFVRVYHVYGKAFQ